MNEEFRHYPHCVMQSSEHPEQLYERQDGLFAVHDAGPKARAAAIETLDDGRIAVLEGSPADYSFLAEPRLVTPVYRLLPNGAISVPTGWILVRFGEPVLATSRARDFAALGYLIAQTIDYAPHAVWLTAVSGDVAQALNGIPELQVLADVVNVEPQMISPAVRR